MEKEYFLTRELNEDWCWSYEIGLKKECNYETCAFLIVLDMLLNANYQINKLNTNAYDHLNSIWNIIKFKLFWYELEIAIY